MELSFQWSARLTVSVALKEREASSFFLKKFIALFGISSNLIFGFFFSSKKLQKISSLIFCGKSLSSAMCLRCCDHGIRINFLPISWLWSYLMTGLNFFCCIVWKKCLMFWFFQKNQKINRKITTTFETHQRCWYWLVRSCVFWCLKKKLR